MRIYHFLAISLIFYDVINAALNSYCTSSTENANLYLSNETLILNAQEYITGFNLTYQISSVNNSGLVSISNPTSPIDTNSQNLETIVSQDVLLTPKNIAVYALLE